MRYDIEHFLTARLDEDEQRLKRIHLPRLSSGRRNGKATIRRQFADIAVKRRIIAEAEDADHASRWSPECDDEHGLQIICLLASVYSDHPDYREEWKP